ncbi:MAG TPA: DMT family transporter [Acidobacteriota bacterium]
MQTRGFRHWLADGALVVVTLIWGFSFVIVKQSLQDVPAFYFNALRFTVATATFLPFTVGRLKMLGPMCRPSLALAAFLFAGFAFQTSGLQFTTPSKSALITASSVILVPVFLWLVFRKRSDRSAVAGVIVAFGGLYLLSFPRSGLQVSPGDVLTAFGAIAWAFHIILIGRYSPHYPVLTLTTLQIFFAGAAFWITALALHQVRPVSLPVVPAVLYTGVLATGLSFVLQTWAQRHTSPTRAGLLFTTEPLFAVITAYFWIGERLTLRESLGGALIVAGVLVAEAGYHWRISRRVRSKHSASL